MITDFFYKQGRVRLFSSGLDGSDYDALRAYLEQCNAFRDEQEFNLRFCFSTKNLNNASFRGVWPLFRHRVQRLEMTEINFVVNSYRGQTNSTSSLRLSTTKSGDAVRSISRVWLP